MNNEVEIRHLLLIAALDSVSYGLIYGFISTYVLQLGGSHITVGILAVGNLIGELLSPDVMSLLTHLHGKRFTLFFILNIAFVTNLMIVSTESFWFTILVRILFSMTNRSESLCLDLLLNKVENDDSRQVLHNYHSFLSSSGYIIGPIISGYLFDSGFLYIGILAALCDFVNIRLLMSVKRNENDKNNDHVDQSVIQNAINIVTDSLQNLKTCTLSKNWDLLLLKYLFASSIITFLSKFTQILKHNFNSSNVTIGYTLAYINIMVFSATYLVPVAIKNINKFSLVSINELSFISIGFLIVAACYAPYYKLFMFLLIPIIILRTLLLNIFKELFSQRKNQSLAKLNNAASGLAGLTAPLFFGIICNHAEHNTVILFSCIPMFMCFAILRYYTRFITTTEVNSN
ncbi:major facilitator superfamily domain-containing protein 9 [Dendroctonus ponderosae]|uniref:major facilitator superfamily domain-containing protein 9 n=1 Tax=Dendroctonus ponderosae TaxID=77166 RepID=UPI002034F379|nr:major facilitator superfamily domain-containing protein 9 [Dendroctonus ponderosae]